MVFSIKETHTKIQYIFTLKDLELICALKIHGETYPR